MDLSNRIKEMQFSPIRKLTPYADDARARGIKLYGLNIGQPDIETPDIFMNSMKNFNEKVIAYTNSQGINTLLDSFIEYYKKWDINFDRDEVLVTNGGSEAILFTLLTICNPGDEVIIPEPFYTNYNSFCDMAGVKVVPLTTKAENGFHLPDKEEIVSKITDKTKAIMYSSPSNPTGAVYTQEEIELLGQIAKEYNLYLISDEAYREFVYDGLEYTSVLYLKDIEDRVILIDSISKRYSACGARIGLAASKNKEVMSEMLKLCQARLCSPLIEQSAAAALIDTPKEYFENVKTEYQKRRDILYKGLKEIPNVICEKPTGAFYVVAKLPVKSADDFARWLLTDFSHEGKSVYIAPAEGFYGTKGIGLDEARFSYCINCEALEDAMKILKIAIEEYQKVEK